MENNFENNSPENLKVNNPKRHYECSYCLKEFVKILNFGNHIKKDHENIKDHKCDSCDKIFEGDVNKFIEHIRTTHKKNNDIDFNAKCETCGKVFTKSKKVFEKHLKSHEQRLDCELCGKIFRNKLVLKRHIRHVHEKLKPHICDVCGKAFTEKTWLRSGSFNKTRF